MRYRRDGYFRTCRIALTARDELAFSRALTERFGKIYCLPAHPYPSEEVPITHLIGALPVDEMTICVESGDWFPSIRPSFAIDRLLGYFRRPSPFHFHYKRCRWLDGTPHPRFAAGDLPILVQETLYGYVPHFDPLRDAIDTFLADVFRCLRQAGRGRARAGGTIWGHDAIRDVLARGPGAVIGRGFRPNPKWKFPGDSPYYRDELWDDDPSSIHPLEVRVSHYRPELTPAEYNAWRASQPKEAPKSRNSGVRNKLGNLRIDPSG